MKSILRSGFTLCVAAGMILPALAQTKEIPGALPPAATPAPPRPDEKNPDAKGPEKEEAKAPATEAEFVQKVATAGMAEVKLAQLAVKKAEGEKVKEVAQMLVKDHTAANEALKEAAKAASIKIDETPDPKCEELYAQLSKQEGTSFDTAFISHMDKSHQKGIAFFEAGRTVSKSEAVIAFIDKTLPVLRRHHEKIKTLLPAVRDDSAPNPEGNPETKNQPEQPRR